VIWQQSPSSSTNVNKFLGGPPLKETILKRSPKQETVAALVVMAVVSPSPISATLHLLLHALGLGPAVAI